MRGRFLTVEGIDGAGKSSQIARIVELLRGRGLEVVSTREPGGTRLGESLRELLLHEPMNLETEALLMFAARREHVAQVIEPALARGAWVVCDRFSDATFAYQGGGRGLDVCKIAQLEQWVHGDLQPDLTLVFDLAPEVAAGRLARAGNAPDKFEREQAGFFARVRAAYHARAANDPNRVRLIDADRPPEAIRDDVEAMVRGLLEP
ncbi:MAG: dTMP kinase [Rhodocyclaceae bacterium]|jgi:dTMP kinase|nr:MAG: dTMP kinase [Rhodocyclaceae bacterium]